MKKDTTITFRINNKLKDDLNKKANELNISLSSYITMLLTLKIKKLNNEVK